MWGKSEGKVGWTQIRNIYAIMAVFNLVAAFAALTLSHQQASIFASSVKSDSYWDAHLSKVLTLSSSIRQTNSPPNDVFDSHDPIGEGRKFELAYGKAMAEISEIKADLTQALSPEQRKAPLTALADVESSLQKVAEEARMVFSAYSANNIQFAGVAMARTDRYTAETSRRLEKSVAAIRAIKDGLHKQHVGSADTLRWLELPMLLVFVGLGFAAAAYGHHMSRTMREQFEELDTLKTEAETAAHTDRLSGLLNRHGYRALIETEASAAAAAAGQAGIIFMDFNGFKEINDSYGHGVGDEVIQQIARRISDLFPDYGHVARIGGDEFAAILIGDKAELGLPIYAELLRRSFDHPVKVDGVTHNVSAAVGYALSVPGAPLSFDEIIHRADAAMYDAKERDDTSAVLYHEALDIEARRRREIEADLRLALANDELYVEYQPIVNSQNGAVVSAEALIRWVSPVRGQVPPLDFIPVAEQCGLIHEVGLFVLKRVCEDMRKLPSLSVSVNVSPVQLRMPNFVDSFARMARTMGVDPARIEVELTENVLIENPARASRQLQALKEAGFSISLDDYGVGFSSLGYLQQLPFDKIKIDRTFIAGMDKSEKDRELLESLALMSRSLNLKVVAEGVETADQAEVLRGYRYDLLQGWHTGRPMAFPKLVSMVGDEGPLEQSA